MKILSFRKFFETNLSLGELEKNRGSEPPRGNVLVKKLLNGEELQVGDKSIKVDKMKKGDEWVEPEEAITQITNTSGFYDKYKSKSYFTKSNRYIPVFQDDDKHQYKLNQIFKNKDFGSSGPGTNVKNFEAIQSIFLAIKINEPGVSLMPDTASRRFREFLQHGGMEKVKLDEKYKINFDILENYLKDADWAKTFCEIPNKLITLRKGSFIDSRVDYIVYHTGYKGEDSPYHILFRKYRELAKEKNFSHIHFSKWCPADVFMVMENRIISDNTKNTEEKIVFTQDFKDDVNKSIDIEELAKTCDRYFDSGILIPISLKRISKKENFQIIVNSQLGADLPTFYIDKFIVGTDYQGIASKISSISIWKQNLVNNHVITFDSSNTNKIQDIDGEADGKTAKHGKISFKAMMEIFKKFILNKKDRSEIMKFKPKTCRQIYRLVEKSPNKNEKLLKIAEELTKKIIELSLRPELGDYVQFDKMSKGSDIKENTGKIISRIQSLQLVLLLMKVCTYNPNLAHNVLTKIMRYALSIETEYFLTPRYLRII